MTSLDRLSDNPLSYAFLIDRALEASEDVTGVVLQKDTYLHLFATLEALNRFCCKHHVSFDKEYSQQVRFCAEQLLNKALLSVVPRNE